MAYPTLGHQLVHALFLLENTGLRKKVRAAFLLVFEFLEFSNYVDMSVIVEVRPRNRA
jgi:hypothetical protein